jgi:photosystem II stability/assembly factor-like uncharacterized protein
VILSTEDGGATWTEAIARLRSSAFEHFQIVENHGWISGQRIEPLPKDPFFMITTDGGKTWRQKALFEESRFGSITHFWFASPASGELIFDDSLRKATNQELYTTMTGGESWELKQKSSKPLQLKEPHVPAGWTASAASGSTTYLIEHNANGKKETLGRFLIHIGDCK